MKSTYILFVLFFCCAFAWHHVAKHASHRRRIQTAYKTIPSENSTFSDAFEDSEVQFYHLNTDESLEKQFGIFREQRAPCSCFELNCGCCAGMQFRKFKRLLCSNFTYDPNEFQVQLDVMNNDQVLYQNMFSAKNPPPMCVPVPYTPASMCFKFFNVFTPGRNLHMCMDMEGKVQDKPYIILHFDCMRMGQDGFKYPLKPEENGGEVGTGGGGGGIFGLGLFGNRPTQAPGETTDIPQTDADIFDPITEIKLKP